MARSRPCRVCRRWFRPDPRVGKRQKTCGRFECQKERKRQKDAQWRKNNPNYWREDRFRKRIIKPEAEAPTPSPPTSKIAWSVAQAEIGLEPAVIMEESGRLLVEWAQAEMCRQLAENKWETGRHGGYEPQAETAFEPGST